MTERQYGHYKDLPRQSLGVCANQLWTQDPKMVGIHLARYKFVAKMLAGKEHVAEVGCGDGWYSRVVQEEVDGLALFDFDTTLSQGVNFHDIIKHGKLPHFYDAIYSLDVMEHIHPRDEKAYLRNICDSLMPEGIFIVGMPSIESQRYASPASKIGHKNCQSGDELKRTLENYFHNVFLFSMHDEVISTAFYPMAHYLMAICVGVK